MRFLSLQLVLVALIAVKCEEAASKIVFLPPEVPENAFLAAFIGKNDIGTKFILSTAKKDGTDELIARYEGKWKVEVPASSAIEDDYSLVMDSKAKHHAIAMKLDKPLKFDTKEVVIQYEVKFQNGHDCGGAYVKLLSKHAEQDLSKFYDKTPFTIMFGPDKCGLESKIHFIFQHQNPVSKKFEEKMIIAPYKPDKAFTDKLTHLYTLVIRDDNTYEIFLDQSSVKSGSLLSDFDPPVNPPKEIPDPTDKKPSDWDEREKIADPGAKKPDDWDETAPEYIPDSAATKPDGWLDKEPLMVPDPEAKKPEDWDVEIDGEWEAAQVENPACKSAPGCGEWQRPQVKNPAYRGKWSAPMIANPAYKGVWKARIVPNPDYFEDEHPFRMTEVVALGMELWTMSDGVVFDNFLIVDSKEKADKWAQQTWVIKHKAELQVNPSAQSVVDFVKDQFQEKPAVVLGITAGVLLLFVLVCYLLCCRSGEVEDMTARRKKDDDYKDESDVDMDKEKEQYDSAGPAASMKKSGDAEPKTNGHQDNDESPDDVPVEHAKDVKVKRRSRKE
ncbi:hypothetical protein Ciccas_007351 [Cichlidogyrus casuarinus]|uniref:Calnexin n=1 Tax=Cichlidogyrus casuarinus TaxID=1844966 RepID=A0ABD2Q3U8_9PLAT